MSEKRKKEKSEPFGTILGLAPGNVPVYSCDYDSLDHNALPGRDDFKSYIGNVYMGQKWQCVEFARRWLFLNKGYVFRDVPMAYDIFKLKSVRHLKSNKKIPLHSFQNGSKRPPEAGCLLIWNEGGEFAITGHVGIVTEVQTKYIKIVEQNLHNQKWPEGQNYSRKLNTNVDDDGGFWIESQFPDASILGWVIQTNDSNYSEEIIKIDKHLFNLELREVENKGQAEKRWLNVANADEGAYVKAVKGHSLVEKDEDEYKYFCISETAYNELKKATNELHYMFLHATDFVFKNNQILEKFCIPKPLWSRMHKSWTNRRNQMVTGRLDFAVTDKGIKVYEYNADSAACYMECGKIQKKWAKHFKCKDGTCAGENLHSRLIKSWKNCEAENYLHIMLDDEDEEETYHALFMKAAIDKAGIRTKVIRGTKGLLWDEEGRVVDSEGDLVGWVWKTWAWETALDQIRDECQEDDLQLPSSLNANQVRDKRQLPRLVDVLLNDRVLVFEPLWTLIPSNKAILPILWMLFPGHPYLLNSQFDLTEELKSTGYVVKPIVGRCGDNIQVFDKNENLLIKTEGNFENRDQVYQELFRLPKIGGRNIQVCTFTASGSFAGACVRADPTLIVVSASDIPALRVIDDDELLKKPKK